MGLNYAAGGEASLVVVRQGARLSFLQLGRAVVAGLPFREPQRGKARGASQ